MLRTSITSMSLKFGRKSKAELSAPAHLLNNNKCTLPTLPTELWIIILEIIIDDIDSFPTASSPCDFPQFISEWDSLSTPFYQRTSSFPQCEITSPTNPSWKRLRLVCKSWAAIIKPQQTLYLCRDNQVQFKGYVNIRTLHFILHGREWGNANNKLFPPPLRDLTQTGSTIAITTMGISSSSGERFSSVLSVINHPQYFPNLRALSIDGFWTVDDSFWSGLERGYPQLQFLRIMGCSNCSGGATLPKLKTLILEISYVRNSTFVFPSLKQVCVYVCLGNKDHYEEFIRSHGTGLDSLVISTSESLSFSDVTRHCPNLDMFGTTTEALRDMKRRWRFSTHSIQSEDYACSFNHFWLLDTTKETASFASRIVDESKSLNRLTLSLSAMSSSSAHRLRRKCKEKSIELVDDGLSKKVL